MERKIIASFKIEKGIPLPPKGMWGTRPVIPYPFLQMEIGDSFWCKAPPSGSNTALGGHYAIVARKEGRKFTGRVEVKDGVKGHRVWRIA
jgi:hypothetical protein